MMTMAFECFALFPPYKRMIKGWPEDHPEDTAAGLVQSPSLSRNIKHTPEHRYPIKLQQESQMSVTQRSISSNSHSKKLKCNRQNQQIYVISYTHKVISNRLLEMNVWDNMCYRWPHPSSQCLHCSQYQDARFLLTRTMEARVMATSAVFLLPHERPARSPYILALA